MDGIQAKFHQHGYCAQPQHWFNTATDTVLSPPIKIGDADGYYGAWYLLSSTNGTPNVTIDWLQSWDDQSDNFVVPEDADPIVTAQTAETAQIPKQLLPVPHEYIKIRFIGNAGNETDTTVKFILRRRRPTFYTY